METTEQLSQELFALHELQREGVDKVFEHSIDSLLLPARQREQARQTYIQACDAFQNDDIAAATQQAKEAERIIGETNYPDADEFSVLRSMVAGQKVEIGLLQDAIELWWWRRFNETYTEVQRLFPVPANEKSIQDAESAIKSLAELLDEWKNSSGERGSAYYVRARKAFEEAATWQDALEEKRVEIQKADYDYWLQFAQSQLDEADEREADPQAALAALSRAKSLRKPEYDAGVEKPFDELERQAQSVFVEQQRERLQARVREIVDQITSDTDQQPENGSQDYLTAPDQSEYRRKVDLLRDYLAVVEVEIDEPVRQLIHQRQNNLYEARRILSDIGVRQDERYDFEVLRMLEDAKKQDPDHEGVEEKLNEYKGKCSKHKDVFSEIQAGFKRASQDSDVLNAFKMADAALMKAIEYQKKFHPSPGEWGKEVKDMQARLEELRSRKEQQEQVDGLAEEWRQQAADVAVLLERTKNLFELDGVIDEQRETIQAAMKERLNEKLSFWPDVRLIPEASSLLSPSQTMEGVK